MKKIRIYYLIIFAFLMSCTSNEILVPESLLVEETNLVFVGEGEIYLNRVWTTSEQTPVVSVPEDAQGWLTVTLEDKHLKMVVQPNVSIRTRSTVVTVTTPERSQTVQVLQNGFPIRRLNISEIRGYSFQPNEGYDRLLDGDTRTYWHSDWGQGSNATSFHPHWLAFDFEPASSLNMITLYPRASSDQGLPPPTALQQTYNGNWRFFLIYVKGDAPANMEEDAGMIYQPWEDMDSPWNDPLGTPCPDDPEYVLVWKGDWRFLVPMIDVPTSATHPRQPQMIHPITIELSGTVVNTSSVKFKINTQGRVGDPLPAWPDWHGSQGGHASLSGAEFFGAAR